MIDAEISEQLLGNIFYEGAPLHDGAVIIRDGRICAAGCVLPLTNDNDLSKDLGDAPQSRNRNNGEFRRAHYNSFGGDRNNIHSQRRTSFKISGYEDSEKTLLNMYLNTGKSRKHINFLARIAEKIRGGKDA